MWLFEDNHLLTLNKPAGLLSQADITGDPDLGNAGPRLPEKEIQQAGQRLHWIGSSPGSSGIWCYGACENIQGGTTLESGIPRSSNRKGIYRYCGGLD